MPLIHSVTCLGCCLTSNPVDRIRSLPLLHQASSAHMTLPGSLDEHDGVTGSISLVLLDTAGCTVDQTLLCGGGQPARLPGGLGHPGQLEDLAPVWQVDLAVKKVLLAGPGRSQQQEQQEYRRCHGWGQEGSEALSIIGVFRVIDTIFHTFLHFS